MRKFLIAFLMALLPLAAFGQSSVKTFPSQMTGGIGQGTISSTGVWQIIATGVLTTTDLNRGGCLLLNTGSNVMYVWFGASQPGNSADEYLPLNKVTSTSIQPLYCGDGNGKVNALPVWITGTSGDTYAYIAY